MDDINLLRTAITVIAFAVYVGIVWWSYTCLLYTSPSPRD